MATRAYSNGARLSLYGPGQYTRAARAPALVRRSRELQKLSDIYWFEKLPRRTSGPASRAAAEFNHDVLRSNPSIAAHGPQTGLPSLPTTDRINLTAAPKSGGASFAAIAATPVDCTTAASAARGGPTGPSDASAHVDSNVG